MKTSTLEDDYELERISLTDGGKPSSGFHRKFISCLSHYCSRLTGFVSEQKTGPREEKSDRNHFCLKLSKGVTSDNQNQN